MAVYTSGVITSILDKVARTAAKEQKDKVKTDAFTVETDGKYRQDKHGYTCIITVSFAPEKRHKQDAELEEKRLSRLCEDAENLILQMREKNYNASYTIKNFVQLVVTVRIR